MTARVHSLVLFLGLLMVLATQVHAQQGAPSDVAAGPYDNGKMWLFENPPVSYLSDTYGFEPDGGWFDRARLSALRLPGCSAAFVSDMGLVVTNHHCVRSRVTLVSEPGENLLDQGFYAPTRAEERPIPGYYADQLVAIEDVTDEIYRALEGQQTEAERSAARTEAIEAIRTRLAQAQPGGDHHVEVTSLYNGGRYSAYVFRRYDDVRLVMAVELALGFFGGEPDNFTYPRYALDFAFLRIYGDDGQPLNNAHYFTMSQEGVREGDQVFVIGNPGSTSRLLSVAQLEYQRDVRVNHVQRVLTDILNELRAYYEEDPATGESLNLRNTIFSVSNSQKAYTGRKAALESPVLIARRANAERQFRAAINADSTLAAAYAAVFDEMAALQEEKRGVADAFGAYAVLDNPGFASSTLRRMMRAYRYTQLLAQGAAPDSEPVREARARMLQVRDLPAPLDLRLLQLRLALFQDMLGAGHPVSQAILQGRTPAEAAAALQATSLLAQAGTTADALAEGTVPADDPGLQAAAAFMPHYQDFQSASAGLAAREQELGSALGRARYAVYGDAVPPDATFSPRITDGVVKGYAYNGTMAPPFTTFYGMYDHANSYPSSDEWTLPERWITPPPELDLATPLNFVSTADTIGGNSGSPVVTQSLELVGLNFDRNVEGLSRDYIYLPEQGRHIAVDVRAIQEALRVMYGADRILDELQGN